MVLLQMLTGRPAILGDTLATRESLVENTRDELEQPKRHMRELVDARAGEWESKPWCALAVIARGLVEHMASDRLAVVEVLGELDTLAGRGAAHRRRGSGSSTGSGTGTFWMFGSSSTSTAELR